MVDFSGLKNLVVGAGFWGAVIAERLASQLNEKVVVIDKNRHPGGASWSEIDPETGIECHLYGSHIFHTSLERVWDYVSKFTSFTNYRHRVLTTYRDRVYPLPVGLGLINAFYGLNLKPCEVPDFIRRETRGEKGPDDAANLEEKAISLVGRPLYEAFIRGYTKKQWGRDPKDLPAEIISRLPVRTTWNLDYFDAIYQGVPAEGYGKFFERLLSNPRIDFFPGVDFYDIDCKIPEDCTVFFSGAIDRFFDYRYGSLEWRSLCFEFRTEPVSDFQGTSVMNYADEAIPWTRVHEFKHFHPERETKEGVTRLCTEYPSIWRGEKDSPYYPVNDRRNGELFQKYAKAASRLKNVVPGGRLGSYRYCDMDRTVDDALAAFEKHVASRRERF
ncbi:MAG: UDP-galactopyranose mutase [Synergistaceae bacterium]|jgi:UDP-galactopyranose mutase|nr:UDP-galactopyranose mutase [Synergistaceae bacterium]